MLRPRARLATSALVAAATLTAAPALARNGNLDPGFAGGGIYWLAYDTPNTTYADFGAKILRQPGKGYVLGGTTTEALPPSNQRFDLVFSRIDADGNTDASFGSGGRTLVHATPNDFLAAASIAPDGSLLFVTVGYGVAAAVVKLSAEGMPDASFGSNGVQVLPADTSPAGVFGLAGGKVLVGGDYQGSAFVLRLNADGSLDTGFGNQMPTDGWMRNSSFDALAMGMQADGKILLAGEAGNDYPGYQDFALMRFTAAGLEDPAFNGGVPATAGIDLCGAMPSATYQNRDSARALAAQPDGKILVAGNANGSNCDLPGANPGGLVRFNANGSRDAAFGTHQVYFAGGDTMNIGAVAVQDDGHVIVGGETSYSTPNSYNLGLARFQADGSVDTGWRNNGFGGYDLGLNLDDRCGCGLVVDGSGALLIGTRNVDASHPLNTDLVVLRVIADQLFTDGFDTF